ncbi:UDP-N-acetylmuramoyl-L-alanyl-D-glutamate--2,6-diaminopimelate ligase [Ligilactobacillus faecis]|uniref:UDP-N-acetylmuramyl-tripeptide synthetase n=1 Tax=Ligilactobacillus faecis TaxID=762833 RepID=A0ABV4DSI7_9LACO
MLAVPEIKNLLEEHQLLQSLLVAPEREHFTAITYDSRKAVENTLFICKGNFRKEYLSAAKAAGATAYVAEQYYPEGEGMTAIIVSDVQKAMALLGAAFYGYPQNELFIIAYTGTKGKTTSAYFARGILEQATGDRTALFSTIDRILGNKPEQRFKSDLTTPESLDLFHDMRQAVANGMDHLVMEVSSQAYKKDRVYGLTFDIGLFLNISPDHIGRNEHPTFEDYLFCKEQLLLNSRTCVINAETDHLLDVYQAAKASVGSENVYLYGRKGAKLAFPVEVDFEITNDFEDLKQSGFEVKALTEKGKVLDIDGRYEIALAGDYNEGNATSALIASALAGARKAVAKKALPLVKVPGRMEMVTSKTHGTVYIDYAHNYASLSALLRFLRQQTHAGKIRVVLGSTGDKGISRREGFGKALSEEADIAYLTTDDPGFEDPLKIAQEIARHIDTPKVEVIYELERKEAVRKAISASTAADVVVLAGRGEDKYMKIKGQEIAYPTDVEMAQEILEEID